METQIPVDDDYGLRPLVLTDAIVLQEALSEEECERYFTQRRFRSFSDTKALVEWLCSCGEYYSMVREMDGKVIGLIGTRKQKEGEGILRISYMILKGFRGRGIAPKGIRALTKYLIQRNEVHRIEAAIRPDNIKSLRCIEKAGYHMERIIDAEAETDGTVAKRVLYVYS